MTGKEWVRTYEDRLLARYLEEHPGDLFLEVSVGRGGEGRGPRRLDGLLVPGPASKVHQPHEYSIDQLDARVRGGRVHLLEAKRVLNRNVIGQVQVGEALLRRAFAPSDVLAVAVCGGGNPDLAWYCQESGLKAVIYTDIESPRGRLARGPGEREDVRGDPDPTRRKAFMKGWDAALEGRLYGSVRHRITHANVGNLFGWIYGSQPDEFRDATWVRYVETLEAADDGRNADGSRNTLGV